MCKEGGQWRSVRGRRRLPLYLEIMELDWDWLEEVVAALSWEKPLWLDSRLVMEPLRGQTREQLRQARGRQRGSLTHSHTHAHAAPTASGSGVRC